MSRPCAHRERAGDLAPTALQAHKLVWLAPYEALAYDAAGYRSVEGIMPSTSETRLL